MTFDRSLQVQWLDSATGVPVCDDLRFRRLGETNDMCVIDTLANRQRAARRLSADLLQSAPIVTACSRA
jgi:hypothetical protein